MSRTGILVKEFYRTAWRESIKCKDYSTKKFIQRKLREKCRSPAKTYETKEATEQLDLIKRVVNMSNIYASELSVLDRM
jgi:hypothetical protein